MLDKWEISSQVVDVPVEELALLGTKLNACAGLSQTV